MLTLNRVYAPYIRINSVSQKIQNMHVYTKLHLNITILLKIICTSVLIRIKTINVDKALFNIACSKKRIQTIHRNLHVLFFSLPLPLKSKVIFFFDI